MKKTKKIEKKRNFLFWLGITGAVILLLGLVGLRFWKLTTQPLFLQEDELVYNLNAKFIALTGKDRTGTWLPWSITPIEPLFDELTAPIIAMAMKLFGTDLFKVRFLSAIFGLGAIAGIGLIAKELTNNKKVGFIAMFLALVNPWLWQISRTNFDCFYSFCFYIWGSVVFLSTKKWWKIISLPIFIVGFYQYQGYKLILAPIVTIWGIFMLYPYIREWWKKKKKILLNSWLPILIVIIGTWLLTFFYAFYQLPKYSASIRQSSILTPKHQVVEDEAQAIQNTTLSWTNDKKYGQNNYTTWLKIMSERWLDAYSLKKLFWEVGEAEVNTYWVWWYGSFYLIDAILIIVGLYNLINRKKWQLIICLGFLILVAPIAAMLNEGEWFLHRSSFKVVPLLILAASGANFIFDKSKIWLRWTIGIIYLISVGLFLNNYFMRQPLMSAVNHRYAPRLVAEYLKRIDVERETTIIQSSGKTFFDSYLFYNDLINKENAVKLQELYREKNYWWQAKNFNQDCLEIEKINFPLESTFIISGGAAVCEKRDLSLNRENILKLAEEKGLKVMVLQSLKDQGDIFYILGDNLCQNIDGKSSSKIEKWQDLNWKQMSDEEFCQKYVINLN